MSGLEGIIKEEQVDNDEQSNSEVEVKDLLHVEKKINKDEDIKMKQEDPLNMDDDEESEGKGLNFLILFQCETK